MENQTLRGASSLLPRSGESELRHPVALAGVSRIRTSALSIFSDIGVPLMDALGAIHVVPVTLDNEFLVIDTNNVTHAIQTDGIVWTVLDADGNEHDIPLVAV